ncbi:MAG TPA: YibE/F family protein, partial [Pseudogracilibacillus sp.]|nr:YibE/F family protein [Pseudogracilibacillus sp.]
MNVPVILSIILCGLMIIIGRRKGLRSFFSLFLNFIVMLFMIVLMTNMEYNPIILTIIACILISCINLFFINEVNQKTVTAFIATMITTGILLVFIYYITKMTMVQGFGEEEIDEIVSVYSIYIGVDFLKLATSVIILSTVAAIVDVAISITSPMAEIYKHHPTIKRKDLFSSGVTIGKDILGSNANTLFFAFIGGYLALLLWFKDLSYSFGQIVNSKIFASELMMIFFAGIGIALVVPIAAFINAYYLTKTKKTA